MANDYRPNRIISCALIVALFSSIAPAVADEEDDDFNRFGFSVGVFLTDRESKSKLNGTLGNEGTVIDLESQLGLDTSDTVLRLDAYYRFNEKHRLDFSVFDLSRSKTRVIDEEIEWGDTIYPVNATINSAFDMTVYKIAYTWAFMRRDKGYLGLTAGLYIASFGVSLNEPNLGSVESDTLTAPLPVFGLRGEYALSDKFTFRGSAEIFAIEYEEYDGSLYDLYAGIDYQLFEHTAIGVGLNSVQLDIGITRERFKGDFDWRYDGGLLFLKFDF